MAEQFQAQAPARRVSEPHRRHQHSQPKYPAPDYHPRRNTDGGALTKVHSRPEDYKNKPRPDKLFEYICFDDNSHPQEADEHTDSHHQYEPQPKHEGEDELNRYDSYSSHNTTGSAGTADTDEYDTGYESEDELTLPPCYHHDVAQRDDAWSDWCKSRKGNQRHHSPRTAHQHRRSADHNARASRTPVRHSSNDSTNERDSSSHTSPHSHAHSSSDSSSPLSRHTSPTGSKEGDNLIAQVAEHLHSHRDEYAHQGTTTSEVVSQLLGEVVRKVSDGGLDSNLMREVVREVQHVL